MHSALARHWQNTHAQCGMVRVEITSARARKCSIADGTRCRWRRAIEAFGNSGRPGRKETLTKNREHGLRGVRHERLRTMHNGRNHAFRSVASGKASEVRTKRAMWNGAL